jgi:hypothetical protein
MLFGLQFCTVLTSRCHMHHVHRRFVDEQEAALWTLKAETGQLPGSFSRPKVWETAANKQALEWIGPEDGYGVTKDVQARVDGKFDAAKAGRRPQSGLGC